MKWRRGVVVGLAALAVCAVGLTGGCTIRDDPPPPPPPRRKRPPKKVVEEPKVKKPPPPDPKELAELAYGKLLAALHTQGADKTGLLALFSPRLRKKHGDKALLATLKAHLRRHKRRALDAADATTTVKKQGKHRLRLVAGHTTCIFEPANEIRGGTLLLRFLGVRPDTRFESYTILEVSEAGLLSTSAKRLKKTKRELVRDPGR